ncbi:MAG: SDR family oxidoreductase [Parvibaculum sp.]|uniref:SDR family NAD(P)-dependent oxidoreductase n=1 Tax=Parvibaculum sp. TaxID=2024848 RepID=UPI0025FA8941|nr:SDR family NAD(P)-dependent oxidoreductase [Parvibaculum sp.]MCE9650177.1 SDR family oxidoreductase [Parvibaculum sp.]
MKKALITGGGGAIASEIATRLDKRGYSLILADIDEARMATVAQSLSRSAVAIRADLSTAAGVAALATFIETEHSDLALLVNNAGYVEPGDAADLAPEVLERHIAINLVAPMQLASVAARLMRARKSGDILSIVSMGGIIALKGSAAYAASKFGLRGFQTSIRSELAPHGVRVMGIFPSGVDTPMLRYEAQHSSGSALNFVGKVFTAAEVADACMSALDSGKLETYVPYGDSVTSRLAGAFPWMIEKILPMFEKAGEKGRAKFRAERGI